MADTNGDAAPAIRVSNLTYTFPQSSQPGLSNISLSLPAGSRTLLVGANGAGKTTLLRLLSGKRLGPRNTIMVNGSDPFTSNLTGITYLGTEWVLNPIVRTDIDVPNLLSSIGGDAYPERRDELVKILDIDLRWRMHAVSDGERRRVQLAMGLLRPWEVLLLDEITVDLDLLSRKNFLDWLKMETERRACTVVYATHILDNLVGWPTYVIHMHLGTVKESGQMKEYLEEARKERDRVNEETGNSLLSELVLRWLREDLEERGPREKMRRGPPEMATEQGIGGYGLEKRPAK
ncbi:CCR4-NOT regulatory complex component [Lithohypha guttulata]|uniref:CCR4-NOT regulatory complex component n=1 Tax=Lithohypha guttulata TaxID=1690604 RepID=A0AAN7SWW2_9EURO|nr:CCR4-NOT regulatory complex component [Lithohypha guttulata]KAK5082871.1 CCR4-NOT regulatory complex component [Lithohypha guttulata]KAK5096683.1 CCR4-NOT regulatory complex component [Lithohypha guttulata]